MMMFPDFDAVLDEDTLEEHLDTLAEDGYQRKQKMYADIQQEIAHLTTEERDAFWEGWYS